MAQRTVIRASHIIGFDGKGHRYLRDGVVVYEGDTVTHVGKSFDGPADNVIDATNKLVTPGFVNLHAHITGSPLDKSLIEDLGQRHFYMSGLFESLPARAAAQDEDGTRACVDYSLAELVLTGSTTVFQMGPLPEYVAEQGGRIGLRMYLGHMIASGRWLTPDGKRVDYAWSDDDGMGRLEQAIDFVKRVDGDNGGLLRGFLAPAQADTCSEALLKRTKEAAASLGVPVQIHASQSVIEVQEMLRRHGRTPVEWLADIGFLGPEVILGHVIFANTHSWIRMPGDDIRLMAEHGCSVAHAPWVFARRGIGLESMASYASAGVNVGMGTDTCPQSMLEAMRWAAVLGKVAERNAGVPSAADVFDAATLGGASALGRDDLGRIGPGAKADILIWDGAGTWMAPLRDPVKNLVYSAQAEDLRTVIINGRTVMEDRRIPGVDRAALAANLQAAGERMWARMHKGDWAGRTADEFAPQSFPLWEGS